MRILQLCPRVPFPLTDGGALGIFNITKELSELGHEVHMVALSRTGVEETDGLENFYAISVLRVDSRPTKIRALSALFSRVPYTVKKYWHAGVAQKILEIASAGKFDLVHADHLHMARYGQIVSDELGIPFVIREHNFETTIIERFYKNQRNPLLKAYGYVEYKKLARYERDMCGKADLNVMITDEDEARLHALDSSVKTIVMSAGVDIGFFRSERSVSSDEAAPELSILSVASMDWLPNVDAVLWFCNKVLPEILKSHPSAVFQIVGRGVPDTIRAKASNNVKIIGFVDDERDYMSRASVMVVPLRIGGGMRLKILNALAMAKAVVTTPIGCEGIAISDGLNISVAEDAAGFAARVSELLGDAELRKKMGESGLAFVRQSYLWPKLVAGLGSEYSRLIDSYRSTGSQMRT